MTTHTPNPDDPVTNPPINKMHQHIVSCRVPRCATVLLQHVVIDVVQV